MTWRDELHTVVIDGRKCVGASFRRVPFFVEVSERSGGRRVVVHKFPFRPDPFVEDLDRDARAFRLEGYVIGDDYLAQKNALLTALEDTAGPGELVLPYDGVRRAICGPLTVRETRTNGGMAVFNIEFHETPTQPPAPTAEVDSASQVAVRADAAAKAVRAELAEKYSPTGLPAFALASAETALRGAAAALGAKLASVVQLTQEAATLDGQIRTLTAQASSLVRQPADLLESFQSTITGLIDTAAGAPGAVMRALLDAYRVDLGPPAPETTETRKRERANQLALTGALKRTLAIEAARLAPLVPYASIEEASAARDRVVALLDEQALGAGNTAYPALVTLRAEVMRAVPGAAVFARVVTVSRRVAIPSLVLAYQLYGSVDQEQDIIKRNGIRHPGFVAGDLKVLSNG